MPVAQWHDFVEEQLGVRPDEHVIVGTRLRLTWMTQHFAVLPPAAQPLAITFFTRAYILRLIGGVLFPDHSQNLVSLVYLEFLRDLQQCGTYSWGSATLAFLYRMLCRATRPGARGIGGRWLYYRFGRGSIYRASVPPVHVIIIQGLEY